MLIRSEVVITELTNIERHMGRGTVPLGAVGFEECSFAKITLNSRHFDFQFL